MITGLHNGDNKLIATTGRKAFHFDLPQNIDKNLRHKIDSVIKYNELSAEHTIKSKTRQLLFKYKQGKDIHEHRKK